MGAINCKTYDTGKIVAEIRENRRYAIASPSTVTGTPSLAMQSAAQMAVVYIYVDDVKISTPLTISGTTKTPIMINGASPSREDLLTLSFEVTGIGNGEVLYTTDEPNGSPASPFTTTAERTAWAAANLATLRSGVSAVWGPGNVEYVWNGPLATDWAGIRGPFLGSPDNPFATETERDAAIPSPSAMQRVWIVNPCVPCGVSPIVYYPSFGWAPEIGAPVVMVWGNPYVVPLTLAGNTGVQILYTSPVIPDAFLPARGIYSVRAFGSVANASGIVNCMVGFGLCGDVPAWNYTNTQKYPSARAGFSPAAAGDGLPINGGGGLIQNLRIAPDRLTFTQHSGGGGRIDRNSIGPFVAGNNKAYAVFQASKVDDSFRFDGFQFNFEGF